MLQKVAFIVFLLAFSVWAFFVWQENYKKHRQIRSEYVKHPELLPKPEVVEKTTFGFSNVIADIYWLQTIQYIWWNAIDSAYKKYLYAILDIVTTLNPYFDHPYIIWMLLLPGYNDMYEDFSDEEQEKYTRQAEKIGLKWIQNFCDMKKIEAIDKEFDLRKIWTEEQYKNPCKNDMIPYSLAFVYYFYLNEPLQSAKYYKVASAIEDSLEWAKIMSAIMQGKWWEREKAIYMFLNMWRSIDAEDLQCRVLSLEIENIMNGLESKQLVLDGKMVELISAGRNQAFWEFNDETEEKAMSETECQNYVNKAVRELNLLYLEQANAKYVDDNGEPAQTGKQLLDAGYIDFDPVDFQQYEDYGVIYEYNEATGNFDYSNGGR